MRSFLTSFFYLLLSLAWFLIFPLSPGAQTIDDWTLSSVLGAGDKYEETEGKGLIIRSNPIGAKVYIDGIERGRTPLYLNDLRPGRYVCRLEKEGYNDRWFRVSVRSGSVIDVSLELKEAVGRLLLKVQPGSGSPEPDKLPLEPRISVDGQFYQSPALELTVGFRTILVRAFGWEDTSTTQYIDNDSYMELELNMKPALFKLSNTSINRLRFNPANSGSLGTTTLNFDVSAPGSGTFTVLGPDGKTVLVRELDSFETWQQSVLWNGRDSSGETLCDGAYTLIVKTVSAPWDDSTPISESFAMEVHLDSTRIIFPLTVSSGKSGLLYAALPALLPPGSFQVEGSLIAGSPPEAGGSWKSLPFSVAFRFSPIERLEVSASLNVIPKFEGDTGAGVSGGAKFLFFNSGFLASAAGLNFSWTGKTGLTPFGMASGFELYIPLMLNLGRLFSISLSPAALWTGDDGFPWDPIPRLLVSGGIIAKMSYVTAGLSVRSEHNFNGDGAWPPFIITAGEVKIFPPPSSFIISLMGGLWVRKDSVGGFGGLGIGMIY